jgi:hypothetical protein
MELIPAHLLRYCSLLSLGSLPAGAKSWLGRATPMCSVYRRHGLPCEDILLLQRDCRCFRTSRHDDSKSLHIPFAVSSCSIAATTRDEALRIAANIASCPELLRAQTDLGTAKESGVAELAVRAMRQHTPEPRNDILRASPHDALASCLITEGAQPIDCTACISRQLYINMVSLLYANSESGL